MGAEEKLTAADILDRIRARYTIDKGWEVYDEVAGPRGVRHLDAVALSVWSSGGWSAIGFEIKVSRADWLRELANPEKRRWFEDNLSEFWMVAPPEVIPPAEVPEGLGLFHTRGDGLVRKIAAKHYRRQTPAEILVRLLRRYREADRHATRMGERWCEVRGRSVSLAELRSLATKVLGTPWGFQAEARAAALELRAKERARGRDLEAERHRWDAVLRELNRMAGYLGNPRRGGARNLDEVERVLAWLKALQGVHVRGVLEDARRALEALTALQEGPPATSPADDG